MEVFVVNLFFYFFIYLITLLWLPIKIKSSLDFIKKLVLTITIFFISTLSIFYFDGIGHSLYSYILVFIVVLAYGIGHNFLKKQIPTKNNT